MNEQIEKLIAACSKGRLIFNEMSVSQLEMVLRVAQKEPVLLRDLALDLGIDPSTTSRSVDRFAGGEGTRAGNGGFGLLKTEVDDQDPRKKRVKLSAKGKNFIKELAL